jgi:hypothetical protein
MQSQFPQNMSIQGMGAFEEGFEDEFCGELRRGKVQLRLNNDIAVIIAPHRLAMRRDVDEMPGGLGRFELQVDGEGGGGEEAVEDCAGFETWGVAGEDGGVAPDGDYTVGCWVVVGRWEEGGDWEG